MSKLHILTVATESKYYFDYLKKSCEINGGKLTVLGYGEKWQGFAWRFKLMIDYLKSLNPDDIVCFVDGYDVICIRNLMELKKVFEDITTREKCKIIVSKDLSEVSTINKIVPTLFFGTCKNQSINAGTYIGYTKNLIEILGNTFNIKPDTHADDQILLTKYCNTNPNDFYIDVNNEIFVVLSNKFKQIDHHINIINGRNYYKNSQPFFIHGPHYTFFDGILIKLGYSNKNDVEFIRINKALTDNISTDLEVRLLHFFKEKQELILSISLLLLFVIILMTLNKKNNFL